MRQLYLFLLFGFFYIGGYSQGVRRYTPTGIEVYAVDEDEYYTETQILAATAVWQDSIISAGWNATIIGPCSSIYNCHGYAWHLSDGGDTVRIPNDYDVSKYYYGNNGQNATYKEVDSPAKYRKVYYNGASHSAIVDPNNPSRVISKWGSGPLVSHLPGDAPYEDYTLEYYELIIDESPASVAKGCAVNVSTLNIGSATYSWSSINNYVCVAGTGIPYTGSVSGLNTTPYNNKGQVKIEISSPYSNTTVKGIKEFTVTSAPSNPFITGSVQICSSSANFTLNNVPSGNTITWSHSTNLSTSDIHANPCTFTPSGSGNGWIGAEVSTACSSNVFSINCFSVWIGVPVITDFSGPTYTPNYEWATYYAQPNDPLMGANDYNWILNPLNDNVVYDYGWTGDIAFYSSGNYQLLVRGQNTCGWGDYAMKNIEVYDSKRLSIFPNPASSEVTLSIESLNEGELPVSEWDLEIYNPNLSLKEIKTKLKVNKIIISTSSWPEGVYFARVKYKDGLMSGILIVKH